MFGEKYSRLTFWIWSILLLIPSVPLVTLSRVTEESSETAVLSLFLDVLVLILGIMWITALANRIRDYGSNPWLSLLALVPLVNIGLALYYGIVKSKQKPEEHHKAINDADLSHIATTNKSFIENETVDSDILDLDENSFYEQAMNELENNNQIKGLWAKSLAKSEGDEAKAKALYIDLRAKELIKEDITEKILSQQRIEKKEKLIQEKFEQDKKKAIEYHKSGGFNKLFQKELEEKGYKIEGNTRLFISSGFFEVYRYATVIDYENYLFLVVDKKGKVVDSFKYVF